MATNRFCLLKIIECLQYLARQAMPMQGDTDEESNFIQLLKLRRKDQPVLLKWLEIDIIDIANEFTALNDNRRKNFGTFKESDFKISG